MKNNKQRTKIGCTIRPFDCVNYKHEHLCNLFEISCEYAKKLEPDKQAEMEQFFLNILGGLEEKKTPYFTTYIDKKNDKVLMEYDKKNARIWLSYDLIWKVFYDRFKLGYSETQAFTQTMLCKHKKMEDVTTNYSYYVEDTGLGKYKKYH